MYCLIPKFTFTISFFFTSIFLINSPTSIRACSSRTIPRPRPSTSSSVSSNSIATTITPRTTTSTTTTTTTTSRPNITFPTYKCPATYDAWYCLNDATCFSVKIGESVMYNCECALGFMGPRCEYKELDGSYLPKRPRPMLEKASIASGATCALLFMFFICLTLYLRYDHQKLKGIEDDDMNVGSGDIFNTINDQCGSSSGDLDCRYCYESRYCCSLGDCNDTNNLLASAEKYSSTAFRQYFQTISPLSIAIKRSTKL